jgi:hypothetical protein
MRLAPFAVIALGSVAIVAARGGFAAASVQALNVGSSSIQVHLTGGYRTQSGSACGARANFTYFHVEDTVSVAGTLATTPASGFRVRIVVERCYPPTFRSVETVYATGGAGGRFKGSFQVHVRSDCFLQVHYPGVTSARAYFRVR